MAQSKTSQGKDAKSGQHSLSWLLDNSIRLPGGYRIGLDGLIGLIPGIGDAIGGALSTVIFYQAVKANVPKTILVRMMINIVIDAVLGSLPIIGDVFDFIWKANQKNADLLARYKLSSDEVKKEALLSTVLFVTGVIVIAFLILWGLLTLTVMLWQAITI